MYIDVYHPDGSEIWLCPDHSRASDLKFVVDDRIKMGHNRYYGAVHWAGMNTG